jgi:hypothetical protein
MLDRGFQRRHFLPLRLEQFDIPDGARLFENAQRIPAFDRPALSVIVSEEGRANRLFWNSPSHRKYQRRILPVVMITETERQRLWRACGIILAKVRLVETFEQIDWSGVGTKEP